jgi:hypothetical protein
MARYLGMAIVGVAAALLLVACDKGGSGGANVAPSASSLAPSVAAPASMAWKLKVDTKGHTEIDMPGPNEHIKAETTGSMGSVDVDLMNIPATRGEIKVDLQSLNLKTFDDAAKNKSQTEHAQTWLEAAPKLKPDVVEANRYAVFAIRSVDNASVVDLTKTALAPGKDGKLEKKVTATVKGELLVHGHKKDKAVDVDITFVYPAGAKPADKPESMVIKTKSPLVITLDEHEIKPRDNVGSIAKEAFKLLGTKVADTASVTFEFSATPGM